MTLPKIDADDAILFGSLALVSVGVALIGYATTNDGLIALGLSLIVFGLPAAIITILAAGETK